MAEQDIRIGLLGRKLGHSYSPLLHALLGMTYSYTCRELEPEMLPAFLADCPFSGFNVTIPYKKDIIPYLCGMSETAKRLGSVNTVRKTTDGYMGYNTDYDGFLYMVKKSGCVIQGKTALVLGSGGVSPTVCAVLTDCGAKDVIVLAHKDNTPENLAGYADIDLLVNTSPVGMYPKTGVSPCRLDGFTQLACVFDLIYNPFETTLMADARQRGIQCIGGISMLVAQARRAAELFADVLVPDERIENVTAAVVKQQRNLILIGMPGCGKSTFGKILAQKTGKKFVDIDEKIVETAKKSIPAIFAEDGEEMFRRMEHQVLCDVCACSGQVIATGGGVVTRTENLLPMQQNGLLLFLDRAPDMLPTTGRPLSQTRTPGVLYQERLPLYRMFADEIIDNHGTIEDTLTALLQAADRDPGERGI